MSACWRTLPLVPAPLGIARIVVPQRARVPHSKVRCQFKLTDLRRQMTGASMAQLVWMHLEFDAGLAAGTVNHLGKAGRGEGVATLAYKDRRAWLSRP